MNLDCQLQSELWPLATWMPLPVGIASPLDGFPGRQPEPARVT